MAYFGSDQTVRTMSDRIESLEAELRQRDHDALMREVAEREQEQHRVRALAEAEARRRHDEEVESTRQSSWYLVLTNPADLEMFKKCVDDDLNPAKIRARIPQSGWPEGDGPEMHSYRYPAPSGDGPVAAINPEDEPALVKQARAMGIQF